MMTRVSATTAAMTMAAMTPAESLGVDRSYSNEADGVEKPFWLNMSIEACVLKYMKYCY